jgi:hypothetical protein
MEVSGQLHTPAAGEYYTISLLPSEFQSDLYWSTHIGQEAEIQLIDFLTKWLTAQKTSTRVYTYKSKLKHSYAVNN